ncbi:hypothetical protein M9H77_04321 [Catharanthus roseus]|uniref:Uncharacterized protein n=1 Tax=Catharanthus roseus TaxID=4058 RepID=A0ACC0CDN4_CATRO|nr:hypothetical protein M9H77_04321 [Catharanthus roseus]
MESQLVQGHIRTGYTTCYGIIKICNQKNRMYQPGNVHLPDALVDTTRVKYYKLPKRPKEDSRKWSQYDWIHSVIIDAQLRMEIGLHLAF